MKKTVNVAIGGCSFIIDEDAYILLDNYLVEDFFALFDDSLIAESNIALGIGNLFIIYRDTALLNKTTSLRDRRSKTCLNEKSEKSHTAVSKL